ncbi:protein kinase [Kitasatospora sp. NPDC058218]|uniref:protein kinase domain-containing protein n=1 Tax=Kitasatospora sp. NPDC058218 TaxID=3346385 RepID=UPI0036D9AC93
MAQTQQPDDDEGARAAGSAGGARRMPEPGSDSAATSALPPFGGGPQTPGRGTAAPLGTVGDGRYRLTHRLGRGGMAEVFAAQDVRLGRTVAVKLLRPELAQDDIARLRFTREAHAVAALNHHSIVAVYDTGEEYVGDESTPYIVMELVEGRTVRELLVDEEAPPVDQALIIIAGVLEALAYSHRHGIVHRDIKPANVIITTTGAVKVMDFGIARALTGTASTMTQTGMVMGTPQYLSPEQALGKPVDHRSDLYAAGCMLYELLTLRPPFTGDTPLSVVYQHVQDMPVPPAQVNGRVPAALDPLVLRSLAKNPDDRFQDADEFRAHLQHALREMHGAGGAWAAGAAAAGLAAAGQGHSGATPMIGTDETAVLGAGVGGPGDSTTVLPYQVPGGPHTPSAPYPGAGGPYGGGHDGSGGGGDDGDDDRRRRGPWGWVAGVAAVLVASGVGIALALSGGNGGGHTPTPAPTPSVSSTTSPETGTPTTGGSSPTSAPVTQNTRKPQQPTDTTNNNNQSPAPSVPSGKHSPSTTPSPTGTKSASATATTSTTPTGGASTTPAGGATGTQSGGATGTQPPPATKPPVTQPPGGGGGTTPPGTGG